MAEMIPTIIDLLFFDLFDVDDGFAGGTGTGRTRRNVSIWDESVKNDETEKSSDVVNDAVMQTDSVKMSDFEKSNVLVNIDVFEKFIVFVNFVESEK